MKTDQQLQKDVMDELKWDPSLTASQIGVSVRDGVVTLTGYVDSFAKKNAAENAAKRVKGVTAVAEEIEVKIGLSGDRNDTQIAEAASHSLKWNSSVLDDHIKLKVENGWITLEGIVDWQYQKNAAANAVRDITGVKGINNLIKITPRVRAAVVENNIRYALERSADVEANNIKVETKGSKVILTGKARSWAERKEVERAAWSCPGVMEVEDDLIVTY